jgi:serine/threonine-protein kinase
MLFQMLTGLLPFRGDSMSELMYKIANEEAPDVRVLRPELSQRLADVVALALSKRPETRYQDGQRFAADLRSSLEETPVRPAGPPGYDASEEAAARATVFAKTNVMSRPVQPGAPGAPDSKTDPEARPGKL